MAPESAYTTSSNTISLSKVLQQMKNPGEGRSDSELLQGARILLADDDARLLDSLHNLLQIYGYQADVAHGGEAALAQLQKQRYDLLLLATDHKAFDYPSIVETFPLIVDTRNALKGIRSDKIFAL